MLLSQAIFSQQEIPKPINDCSNHNAFRFNESNQQLNYYTEAIQSDGLITFNLSKTQEVSNFQSILSLMNIGTDVSFMPDMEIPNTFDSSTKTIRYQQYYKNVAVEGGGYALIITTDPCPKAVMMSAYIGSNINVSVQPQLSSTTSKDIIAASLNIPIEKIQTELVLTQNILNDCVYRLAWRNTCAIAGGLTLWVDANSGTILKRRQGDINLTAPTINYGPQALADNKVGNITKLESSDGKIVAYNFTGEDCENMKDPVKFTPARVPQSTHASNWTNEATTAVYQTFWVTGELTKSYATMGINFNKIKIGAGCNDLNSVETAFLGSSPSDETYVVVGAYGGNSVATFDVIGHELMHAYITQQLKIYTDYPQQGGLHEGLADIFGTYLEYLFQKSKGNSYDWIIGDDAGVVVRNMKNPPYKCYSTALAKATRNHDIGATLGYWFSLIVDGDASKNIPALGIEKAMAIVLEAVSLLKPNNTATIDEGLRLATLEIAKKKFGPCSDELSAIGNAWNEIMCGKFTFVDDCGFAIKGPNTNGQGENYSVCEENNRITLHIEPHNPAKHYRYYFPMGWGVANANGNSLEVPANSSAGILNVTNFPTYSHYPQYFEVEVLSVTDGIKRKVTVKLMDCDGDDPTDPCGQSAKISSQNNSLSETYITPQQAEKLVQFTNKVKVFDIMGRMIFDGYESELPNYFPNYSTQLLIFMYFDEQGRFIKSTKKINLY